MTSDNLLRVSARVSPAFLRHQRPTFAGPSSPSIFAKVVPPSLVRDLSTGRCWLNRKTGALRAKGTEARLWPQGFILYLP